MDKKRVHTQLYHIFACVILVLWGIVLNGGGNGKLLSSERTERVWNVTLCAFPNPLSTMRCFAVESFFNASLLYHLRASGAF